ncbi:tRNA pseudouridine(13) synthase TruD [Alkalilimnicola ehrlichii]|nr:tRNA pseudouridine(13) synthase TruD [Alkalilimnicola ehrlichii]
MAAYAYGEPGVKGVLRAEPEDFQVLEIPSFTPSGEGEHLFLLVRKRGWTTDAVAGLLAKHLGVSRRQVSYAGMKDRWAVTEQWFSVQLPGRPIELAPGELADGVTVRAVTRNLRKLRRGALAGNRFVLRVRDLEGDLSSLSQRLLWVGRYGVPNYFGEQRFGRGGDNVERSREMFAGTFKPKGRNLRGLLLSAARAHLFNNVLSARVADGTWKQSLDGDLMMLDGRNSVFPAEAGDASLERRLLLQQIHPTGPLPGRETGMQPEGSVAMLEAGLLAQELALLQGLQSQGVESARRALRIRVADLWWRFPENRVLELGFALPAGAYATSVLRELVRV